MITIVINREHLLLALHNSKYPLPEFTLKYPEQDSMPLDIKAFMLELLKNDKSGIDHTILTCSEIVVRTCQLAVIKGIIDRKSILIIDGYFENGRQDIIEITINKDGSLSRPCAPGFTDVTVNISMEIFMLKNNARD